MIMVGPRLPWLTLKASQKPNSAKDSVYPHASTFCKVNSKQNKRKCAVTCINLV